MVKTGLEILAANPPKWLHNKRLGLLCNPASVTRNFTHASQVIPGLFPLALTTLFSPQHGYFADKQDNMVESGDTEDPFLGIPVYSLYGKTRIPAPSMMENMDILLVDIQDVGTRVYTFVYTLSYCMETAKKCGIPVVVLDRPNPVGGLHTEGNLLDPDFASFVGRFPIPMRHGLTIGELAALFNEHFGIHCDLKVIPMDGWKRKMVFTDTGLPWVAPSPNLPTPASTYVYPGQVILEGTNLSEGRGTTLPFEIFGAPYLSHASVLQSLGGQNLPGVHLRKLGFEPTSNKWTGKFCKGFQLHIVDQKNFSPVKTTLRILEAIIRTHKEFFSFVPPPYEYEYEKMPVDLILGTDRIRKALEQGEDLQAIFSGFRKDEEEFSKLAKNFWLYT